jgi:hypothetical protein
MGVPTARPVAAGAPLHHGTAKLEGRVAGCDHINREKDAGRHKQESEDAPPDPAA